MLRLTTTATLAAIAIGSCPQPLLDPTCCTLTAPATFNVTFNTTVGEFTLHIERQWAPLGVDRFYNLAYYHYFDSNVFPGNNDGFFRVVPGFVVQFGIAGVPAVSGAWENANIQDDPVVLSNVEGTIAFASGGPNTRTTQVYINYSNNSRLDARGFSPFGKITDAAGLAVVNRIYSGYGQEPDQVTIHAQGNAYLASSFPLLDYITSTIVTA